MCLDYKWQTEFVDKWNTLRTGILEAVPGAGKTRAGLRIIELIATEVDIDCSVLIVVPTHQIYKQWKKVISGSSLANNVCRISTYFGAIKIAESNQSFDLVIYDECHSLLSEKRSLAANINRRWHIGLSATPEESTKILGNVIYKVDWKEANTSPFSVKYVDIHMTLEQRQQHERLTSIVKWAMKEREEGRIDKHHLMTTIMKRRSFIYTLPQRVEEACRLVKKHLDRRIMLFCERLEQVNQLSDLLTQNNIQHSIYTSEKDTIEKFAQKEINVLISSRMLKEGFDDPETSVGIIVSTPLSRRNHIQTVGRIVRAQPGKVAIVYVLLATGTSDETIQGIGRPITEDEPWGDRYSLDTRGKIFIKFRNMRRYTVVDHPELVKIIRDAKYSGRFYVFNGRVKVSEGKKQKLIGLYDSELTLETVEEFEYRTDLTRPWTQEENDNFVKRLTEGWPQK